MVLFFSKIDGFLELGKYFCICGRAAALASWKYWLPNHGVNTRSFWLYGWQLVHFMPCSCSQKYKLKNTSELLILTQQRTIKLSQLIIVGHLYFDMWSNAVKLILQATEIPILINILSKNNIIKRGLASNVSGNFEQ